MSVARSADPLALYAYAGPLEGIPAIDPPVSATNQMVLQANFLAENVYGFCKCGPANVFLWRDPLTGSGVIIYTGVDSTVRYFDGTGDTTMYPPLAGTLRDKDGVAIATPVYNPLQGVYPGESVSFMWAVEGGNITIWNFNKDHSVSRWTADLTAYINTEGGPAYALWREPDELLQVEHIAILRAPYIELRGLEDGRYAKAVKKFFNPFNRNEYVEVWLSAPAVDGVARLYPDSIEKIDRYYNVVDTDPHERLEVNITVLMMLLDSVGSSGTGIFAPDMRFGDVWQWADTGADPDDDTEEGEDPVVVTVPLPPYRPGAFINPSVEGEVLDTTVLIPVSWNAHAPAHPQGESVEYYTEYSPDNGATWSMLHDWQASTSFDWDHSEVAFTRNGKLRVKARGTINLLESGWTESPSFVLYHFAGVEVLNGLAHDNLVASVTTHSVCLQVAYHGMLPGHRDTHWIVYEDDGETVLYDEVVSGDDRLRHWVTGFGEASKFKVQYSFIDYLDNEGEMSAMMDFWTLRLAIYKPIYARDLMGNIEDSKYVLAGYPFGETLGTGQPEISTVLRYLPTTRDRIGVRLNLIGQDLDVIPDTPPEPNGHVLRLLDPDLRRFMGGGLRKEWTAMLITIPMDLSVHAELMGQPTDQFVYYRAGGDLYFAVRSAMSSNYVVPFAQKMQEGQQHAIFVGTADWWFDVVGGKQVPKAPYTTVQRAEAWTGLDGTWERTNVISAEIEGVAGGFSRSHAEMFDIGHGSSNFANNLDIWANGRYSAQIALAAAYWPVILSSDHVANIAALQDDEEALTDYIMTMDTPPVAFVRVDEFPPPNKPNLVDA